MKVIREIIQVVVILCLCKAVTGLYVPAVVVMSGSMEPSIQRGDILLLTQHESHPPKRFDIVVFTLPNKKIPIVHRVKEIDPQKHRIITQGDANQVDDKFLYPRDRPWLEQSEISGRVRGVLPFIGYPLVWAHEILGKYYQLTILSIFIILHAKKMYENRV